MGSEKKELRLHTKQREAMSHLMAKGVHTVLFGGAVSGGKTRLLAMYILWSAITYPGTRYLIGRKRLTDLRSSTLVTLFDVAKEMGIGAEVHQGHNQSLNTITLENGSTILLRQLDVKPSDSEMVELGSLEITAAGVDEVGEIDEIVYTTLLQRIRYKLPPHGGKILLVSNPTKNWAYRRIFIPNEQGVLEKGTKYVHCLPSDNPFNDASYLNTLTIENLGSEQYYSRVLGDWHYSVGDQDLFIESDIINAINWDTIGVDQKRKTLSIDVATKQGSDSTVAMLFHGNVLARCWEWKGKDTVELHRLISAIITSNSIHIRNVIVDAVGVGQGLHDLLRGSIGFKSNNTRLNNEGYQTMRDQMYYKAAELFSRGVLRLRCPEVHDQLIKELCAHKRHNSESASLARVTPKDQVVRSIGKSPDYSDAFTMAMVVIAYRKNDMIVDIIRL